MQTFGLVGAGFFVHVADIDPSIFLSILVLSKKFESGMSTLRMEPQFMTIGHAAGVIASIAIESKTRSVQEIDVDLMRARLEEEGGILELPR